MNIHIIFKRKKAQKLEEDTKKKELKSGLKGEKKQIIKESLSGIFKGIKEKIKRKPRGNEKEELNYKELEKEIKNLGNIPKKKKIIQ